MPSSLAFVHPFEWWLSVWKDLEKDEEREQWEEEEQEEAQEEEVKVTGKRAKREKEERKCPIDETPNK